MVRNRDGGGTAVAQKPQSPAPKARVFDMKPYRQLLRPKGWTTTGHAGESFRLPSIELTGESVTQVSPHTDGKLEKNPSANSYHLHDATYFFHPGTKVLHVCGSADMAKIEAIIRLLPDLPERERYGEGPQITFGSYVGGHEMT